MSPSKADAPYADLSTFQDSGACPNPFKMAAHQDATAILRPGCPSSAPLQLPMPGPGASEWTGPGPGRLEIDIPKKGIEIPKKGIGLSKCFFFWRGFWDSVERRGPECAKMLSQQHHRKSRACPHPTHLSTCAGL